MAASAAGTNNAVPSLCTVGDGAGAPTTSTAAVTPKLEQATRTMKEMVRTEASFKLSITVRVQTQMERVKEILFAWYNLMF